MNVKSIVFLIVFSFRLFVFSICVERFNKKRKKENFYKLFSVKSSACYHTDLSIICIRSVDG